MSLDVTLLQVMKERKQYNKLRKLVNPRALDLRTSAILADFGKYFEEVPDCKVIPMTREFRAFFAAAHRTLTEDQFSVYFAMFDQISQEPDEVAKGLLVEKMLEADLAVQLSDIAEKWTRGEEIDLGKIIRKLADDHESEVQRRVDIPFVKMTDDMFDEDVRNDGLTWRWECLNHVMRPLRGGDFIIIAGRPDKGKTTMLADNLTFMAPQVARANDAAFEVWKAAGRVPEDRPPVRYIQWFNNEGPGKRIMKRIVQSALGIPMSQIVEKQNAGTLWQEYEAIVGGYRTVIQVLDVHGYKSWQIEEVIRQVKPALMIFDMIDNIQFDGALLNGGQRTDQMLEAMYQWGRDLAVRHDCPVIATSQISADGDGMAYPTLSMLKDSKTGKQGAADAIITIGAKNEPAFENTRFIGLTKNKLRLEGRPQSPRAELILDGPSGRYIEAKQV